MISESLNLEIWDRLIQGRSLDGLALGHKDNRIDLGGLELPEPMVLRRFQFNGIPMANVDPSASIQNAKWQNLDFTGSKLNGLRLFGCELSNCRLDRCQLRDFRVWGSRFDGCSFVGANLRKAALGGVQNGKRNSYTGIDFSGADLRETAYKAAAFERCIFRNTNLEKVDFQTSTFVNCQFEGELLRVLFYHRGFQGEAFPANEMSNVDFGQAQLRYVEFRGLNLDRVKLPNDAKHILIENYPAMLDRVIAALQSHGDIASRKLVAYLGVLRKWVGPNQVQGVLNTEDLTELAGIEGLARVRELLGV